MRNNNKASARNKLGYKVRHFLRGLTTQDFIRAALAARDFLIEFITLFLLLIAIFLLPQFLH